MKKILLTGGGTAGHVTPNIALLPYLRAGDFEIEYIGSYDGIEKNLIKKAGIPYHGISSGKLRRYFSLKNISDIFRILKGMKEAKRYLMRSKPDVVFSKGGFVTVPVIFAASKAGIPVVIHESDLSPGLANKLSIPKAARICYNFPETKQYLPVGKSVHTGLPVRAELLEGDRKEGLEICGFDASKPMLLIIGGSLGSVAVNEAVRNIVPKLVKNFNVAHICGEGKTDETMNDIKGYKQFEYAHEDLPHIFAAADMVISRAGANVIHEIAALNKPSLLIPLGKSASRGDQILNANSFKRRGFAEVLYEENLTDEALYNDIVEIFANRASYVKALEKESGGDGAKKVYETILQVLDE